MITMNWLDLVILSIVIISMSIGLFRGFVKESISLATWVVAAWLALFHYTLLSPLFEKLGTPVIRDIISGTIIFLVILILGGIFNYVISRFVKFSGLSFIDRIFGLGFGVLRGILIVSLIILMAPGLSSEPWWKESLLIPKFQVCADQIATLIPKQWNDNVANWLA